MPHIIAVGICVMSIITNGPVITLNIQNDEVDLMRPLFGRVPAARRLLRLSVSEAIGGTCSCDRDTMFR
jgi:hypothetical protein